MVQRRGGSRRPVGGPTGSRSLLAVAATILESRLCFEGFLRLKDESLAEWRNISLPSEVAYVTKPSMAADVLPLSSFMLFFAPVTDTFLRLRVRTFTSSSSPPNTMLRVVRRLLCAVKPLALYSSFSCRARSSCNISASDKLGKLRIRDLVITPC